MRIYLASYGKKWKNVKKGDFVQKVWWYDDVWAEVLDVSNTPRFKSISYASADTRSGRDSVFEFLRGSWINYFQIIDVCTLAQLKKKRVRIIHTKDGSYGYDMSRAQNSVNPNLKPGWPTFLSR